MGLRSKFKHIVSFLLHGETKPVVAHITYLQADRQLEGKKIIITGGGRGIGYAMAKRFKASGADVLISGRDETKLKAVADEIGCSYLKLDLRDIGVFDTFIDDANRILGGANCLVNNAGISLHENGFLNVQEEQFDAQFDTNLKGAFFLTQSFLKKRLETKQDEINKVLFISSETGMTADERPYGLTKAALNSLVQGIAYRYVNEGFRINALAPGVTVTDMVDKQDDGNLYCSYGITKRYYLPGEVAEVACFLLSDASNCINGQIINCNEGKTINARWK